MALYTGRISLGDAFTAPLRSDRADGLWPTVVTDPHGRALGLVYSDAESVAHAVEHGVGAYHSRRRGLWVKGETSGATQRLLSVETDCDRDALRFVVEQAGVGFCHEGSATCWGDNAGLAGLERTVTARLADAPAGSYTRRLFDDPALLRAKLVEEAGELADAESSHDVAWEAADVLYFTMVAMARAGVELADVARQLDRRALKISRRKGDAK
jgi:phosphoribosyl-ATP pyrophosphohydrolase